MKSIAFVLVLCCAALAYSQDKMAVEKKMETKVSSLHGYVVDQQCAKGMLKKGNPMERAAKHTKECALEEACAASGYGLFYGDGKWVKFDDKGDKLAKSMFENSKKEKDFVVDVKGEMHGDKFAVASLAESSMSGKGMGKTMKKEPVQEKKD